MRRVLVAGVLVMAAARARAQETLEVPVLCAGQTITEVVVRTLPPFAPSDVPWYRAPLRLLENVHSTTRPSVVRRYVLMEEGDPCSERLRRETERLLRTYPFFAAARVGAYDDGPGRVKLIVVTTDELTVVGDASFRGSQPTSLTIGERNVAGTGTEVVGRWRDEGLRNGFGLAIVDHQFLGLPYELSLLAERGNVGERRWLVEVSRPFLIDAQRRAWRVTARESREAFPFVQGRDLPQVEVGISRRFIDVGGVMRLGPPGRLSLFGVSFSREDDETGVLPRPDTTGQASLLADRYEDRHNARINALWGFRSLDFTQMGRVDALTAEQDIARGVQLGLLFGRSLDVLATPDDDILIASDLYIGAGNGRTLVRITGRGEGRQNNDTNRWDGVLVSGQVSLTQLVGSRHTVDLDAEWSGGWRQRSPFQLTLGDRQAGVRGYRKSQAAGGQRTVLRAEDRWLIDTWMDDADVAGSVFVDVGRLWAGDVPYGVKTPFQVGVGVGLLAAVPSGSRRTYRLELAFPLDRDTGAGWEVRLRTISAGLPLFWREPDDVSRSRERAVPRSVF